MNSTWLRVNTLRTSSNRSSVAILCADPDDGIDEILGGLQTLRRRQLELVADLNDIAPVQPPLRHLQLIVVGGDPFHLWVRGPVVPWVHDRILPKVRVRQRWPGLHYIRQLVDGEPLTGTWYDP